LVPLLAPRACDYRIAAGRRDRELIRIDREVAGHRQAVAQGRGARDPEGAGNIEFLRGRICSDPDITRIVDHEGRDITRLIVHHERVARAGDGGR
jgi:hypothetical protein